MVHGGDPNSPTVHEALSGPEREQYLESYGSERSSQTRRGVFTCIRASEVPAGRRVLPSKVVFKKKLLADGSLDKYKARICVNGNLQRAGEDYDPGELFAPVARFTSLRVLVSLAAANGWKLRQFDIETAFLYADLDEEVYVRPPRRFEEHDEDGEELVWKLHKSLYGLRQAPRNWYLTFTTWLLEYGFSRSLRDPCVFVYKDSETGELEGTMAVHVDDAPTGLAGADEWYEAFLTALKAKFNFKLASGCRIASLLRCRWTRGPCSPRLMLLRARGSVPRCGGCRIAVWWAVCCTVRWRRGRTLPWQCPRSLT
jgi:hypothetical protein